LHPPSLGLSRGHFYFAQRGHYHFAVTVIVRPFARGTRHEAREHFEKAAQSSDPAVRQEAQKALR
jgi:hypothetical protein